MEIRNWNELKETIEVQKDYVPLTIKFGIDVDFVNLFHYRIISNDSLIEWHFQKKDCALIFFNIINLSPNVFINTNNRNIESLLTTDLNSLYCKEGDWIDKNKETITYITHECNLSIERYNNGFKLNFNHLNISNNEDKLYKLSENFIISLSPKGVISSAIILNQNFERIIQ